MDFIGQFGYGTKIFAAKGVVKRVKGRKVKHGGPTRTSRPSRFRQTLGAFPREPTVTANE